MDLRAKLNQDISKIEVIENYKANEELFTDLKEKLFESPSIKKLQSELNPFVTSIFNEICVQLTIKVFTLHPFVNVKAIRQKAFSWILMELEKTVANVISNPKMDFREFRYLKFLLRRATLMGSNYLIRNETLDRLRQIYKKYTPEEKKKYENRRRLRIEDYHSQLQLIQQEVLQLNVKHYNVKSSISDQVGVINKQDSLQFEQRSKIAQLEKELISIEGKIAVAITKIKYIKQALNNISYKEASLSEFSYFYVALIKELTLNNDSKVLILEENLRAINPAIDKESEEDFFFLVRLLQFENVSLIHQGLKIIVNEYFSQLKQDDKKDENLICFSRKCSEKEVEEKMHDSIKLALSDYRLASFKKFLGLTDFEEWSKSKEFPVYIHVLYLIAALQKEETKPCNISLEEKTKSIIQNVYRVAGYPNFDNDRDGYKIDIKTQKEVRDYTLDGISLGGFFSIRYKADKIEMTNPEEIIVAQATSCLLYTSPSPRDRTRSRMPSSA